MTGIAKDRIFFVGVRDVAEKAWTRLRDPAYRREHYEAAYDADCARHGGELSLEQANVLLQGQRATRRPAPSPDALVRDYGELSDVAEALYGEVLPTLRLWFHYRGKSGVEYVLGASAIG